jgi:SAM-dependent methyltransferase
VSRDCGDDPHGENRSSVAGANHADVLSQRWLAGHSQGIWRRHSDAVNSALVERWLPGHVESLLKTDLFDEAVSGGLYRVLSARAERMVGVDLSRAVTEAAAARHPGLVAVHADVRALPFGDAEFAAVVSNSTLDHFDSAADITAGLREIGRVLRPGGTLVVTLDNPWNPVVALGKALPRHSLNRAWLRLGRASARVGLLPYHVGATLSLPRLRRLLRSLGFDIAVIAASLVTRRASPLADDRFLRALGACEHLARWPTRAVTGHFVAVRALRRHAS